MKVLLYFNFSISPSRPPSQLIEHFCSEIHYSMCFSYIYRFFFSKILTLRAVHEQLVRLLSTQEQQEMKVSDAFQPFAGLNPLQYNPYTQPLWNAAVSQYDRAMAPAEQRIAGKLKHQFHSLEGNSQQVNSESNTLI